ncbi:MAG: hypothetical protein AAGF59_00820 [Pseudomonadota bacterium]
MLGRMIYPRGEGGLRFTFIIQVDTLRRRLDGFIGMAARGGCNRVFIGLENIAPDTLNTSEKRQSKIWEYRPMLQALKDTGYIPGFPDATPETIHRNIEIIKKELPLDFREFFSLEPAGKTKGS